MNGAIHSHMNGDILRSQYSVLGTQIQDLSTQSRLVLSMAPLVYELTCSFPGDAVLFST